MTFRGELSQRIATLRRAAFERYNMERGSYSEEHIVGGGVVDIDGTPRPQVNLDPRIYEAEDLERIHSEIEAFIDSVESLVRRLEYYLDLDTAPFRELGEQLGGGADQALRKGTENAVQRLLYAYDGDPPPAGTYADGTIDYGSGIKNVDALVASGLWDGPAAETFVEGFLAPMASAVPLHMACLLELRRAVEAYRIATKRAQQDLTRIADTCIAMLTSTGGGLPGESNADSVGILVDAVGLVVDVVTVDWVDLGLEAVSTGVEWVGGLVGAEEYEEKGPVEITVSGVYSTEIVSSTLDAITRLEELWTENDATMRDGLDQDLSDGNPYRHGHWNTADTARSVFFAPDVELDRPEVADRSDTFGASHADAQTLVAAVTYLYQAGWLNLPSAAHQYNEAVRVVNGLYLPTASAYTYLTSLSRENFYTLRDRLSGIFTTVCDSLVDAGTNLVQIATNYEATESQNVAQFDQLRQQGFEQVRTDHDPPPVIIPTRGPTSIGAPHHHPTSAG